MSYACRNGHFYSMEKLVTKRLLFDFFSEKTTTMQRKLIEEWLMDPGHEELYYQYLDEWESGNPQFLPDVGEAVKNYQYLLEGESIAKLDPEKQMTHAPRISFRKWFPAMVAASLIVLVAFVFKKDLMYQTLRSERGHSKNYKLPDGTQVLLNANSALSIPRFGFGDESREVLLEGEADFKVTHTRSNKRFIVNMSDNYRVEVLGTQFVAYSRPQGKRVFLLRGKVKLQLPEGKQLYMKPGNLFTSEKDGASNLTIPAKPKAYTAWTEQMFYFDNTLLSDVARQMEERFGVEVRISDTLLSERRIGGIYLAEHSDDLLQILSELLQIEVIQKQNHIELRIPKNQ